MAVLDPVKLIITNYPEDKEEWLEAENNQEDESAGYRKVPFSRELYIEREDFKEQANSKYFRLSLGKQVRLKNAYIIKGESVLKDANDNIKEIQCTYSEDKLIKVKGTLHWVSIKHAIKAEVREYDRLFLNESPDGDSEKDFMVFLNPDSLKIIEAFVEPSLIDSKVGDRFQFQRLGYFNVDKDSKPKHLVFNKIVGLRDNWAKQKTAPSESNVDITKQQQPQNNQQERQAIEIIKQLGKKLTNLPEAKQIKTREDIRNLAKDVSYEDLLPLFNTASKKVGTRIATMIVLNVLLENGLPRNQKIDSFISTAIEDKNDFLTQEAKLN